MKKTFILQPLLIFLSGMKNRYLLALTVLFVTIAFSLSAQTTAINQPPNIIFYGPVNSIFTAPANFALAANVTDDGKVAKVEFYKGDVLLVTDSIAPYETPIAALAQGDYKFKVKAYDNLGSTATFTRSITVNNGSTTPNNQPPAVAFMLPTTYTFAPPATIKLEAYAKDPDGTVTLVEFFNNDVLIGSSTTVPYTATLSSLPIGIYKVKIKATDNSGFSSSVTREIKVQVPVAANLPPTVAITAPTAYSFLAPATFDIKADAKDPDGTVVYVAFYKNDDLIRIDSVAPYTASLSGLPEGNYILRAKAVDNNGASLTYSRTLLVAKPVVPNVPPTVKVEVKSNNGFVAPSDLVINADAKDIDGTIKKVEFSFGAGVYSVDSIAPYTAAINGFPVGSYTLAVKAYDNKGATSTATLSVTIAATNSNINQAPIVKLDITPLNTVLPATVLIKADAKDPDGTVKKVIFYQGDTQIGVDSIAPYEQQVANLPAGNYVFKAKAIDNKGAYSIGYISYSIGAPVQNKYPEVKFTAPTSAYILGPAPVITLSANASDSDGKVVSVTFYNGDKILYVDSIAPYTFDWKNVANGTYVIKAKAIDNLGSYSTTSRTIIVGTPPAPNQAPSVTWIQPTTSYFTAPANISLEVNAKDPDGKVVAVLFYIGDKLILADSVAPYKASIANLPIGNYQISAKALDNQGASVTSSRSIVVEQVKAPNLFPTVSITKPTGGLFLAPATLTVEADAKDPDGFIKKVVFFLNDSIVGVDTIAPYSANFPTLPVGQYNIRARAYDNQGYYSTTTRGIYVSTTLTPKNLPPTIYVIEPKPQGSAVKAQTAFTIKCDAKDPDGTVKKVEFFRNDALIGTDSLPLYEQAVAGLASGSYTFKIKATDDKGAYSVTFITVVVYVNAPNALVSNNSTAIMYPNPFQSELNINAKGIASKTATVSVIALNGQLMMSQEVPVYDEYLQTTLATEALPTGAYMLRIQAADQVVIQKLIKE